MIPVAGLIFLTSIPEKKDNLKKYELNVDGIIYFIWELTQSIDQRAKPQVKRSVSEQMRTWFFFGAKLSSLCLPLFLSSWLDRLLIRA